MRNYVDLHDGRSKRWWQDPPCLWFCLFDYTQPSRRTVFLFTPLVRIGPPDEWSEEVDAALDDGRRADETDPSLLRLPWLAVASSSSIVPGIAALTELLLPDVTSKESVSGVASLLSAAITDDTRGM